MEEVRERIVKKIIVLLDDLENTVKDIQDNGFENEQFALNFLDELNRISVLF